MSHVLHRRAVLTTDSLTETLVHRLSSPISSLLGPEERLSKSIDRNSNRANDRYLSTPLAGQKWNKSKWFLLCGYGVMFCIGLVIFLGSMLTWGDGYHRAAVVTVGNMRILIIATIASILTILNSLVAFYGILKNNRKILTMCTIALWPLFALTASCGYLAYKRSLWNLRSKLGTQWRGFTDDQRLIVQNNLHCCGFQGPLDHAALSNKCYIRSLLPGCFGKYYRFSAMALK
ncbi:hypothetical protein K7432_002043, partial [Basidiobolus ranarum]